MSIVEDPGAQLIQTWLNTVLMIVGFASLATIVYKISQKFSKIENTQDNHSNQLTQLDKRIDEARLETKESRVEYRAQIDTHLAAIKKEYDKDVEDIKFGLKDINSEIRSIRERIGIGQQVHEQLDKRMENDHNFFTNWIQRIEDNFFGRHRTNR